MTITVRIYLKGVKAPMVVGKVKEAHVEGGAYQVLRDNNDRVIIPLGNIQHIEETK